MNGDANRRMNVKVPAVFPFRNKETAGNGPVVKAVREAVNPLRGRFLARRRGDGGASGPAAERRVWQRRDQGSMGPGVPSPRPSGKASLKPKKNPCSLAEPPV